MSSKNAQAVPPTKIGQARRVAARRSSSAETSTVAAMITATTIIGSLSSEGAMKTAASSVTATTEPIPIKRPRASRPNRQRLRFNSELATCSSAQPTTKAHPPIAGR